MQRTKRKAERKFVAEGWHALDEALLSDFHIVLVAVLKEHMSYPDHAGIFRELRFRGIAVKELNNVELKQVSDTVHSQGIVAVVEQRTALLENVLARPSGLLVLADRVADPGNMGTMIRTCDWFGVDALFLSEDCVDPYNEKVVRSTSGSIFHLPLIENVSTKEIIPLLKQHGYRTLATSGSATLPFRKAKYGERTLLIFGNEAEGISDETQALADDTISIPGRGKAESLNVGIACGIILSHVSNID